MTKDLPSLALSRFAVGFDEMFRELERISTHTTTFPPHNIVKYREPITNEKGDTIGYTPTNKFAIELAVAGYAEDDIDIQVSNNMLDVKGQKPGGNTHVGDETYEYIHNGIAMRSFRRSFRLAEHVAVTGAKLENGLLTIELEKQLPESLKPRKIELKK